MPKIVTFLAGSIIIFLIFSSQSFADSSNIEINEIFANPKGKDKGNEWVELYNNSGQNIDLLGWKLSNSGKKETKLKESAVVGAHDYFILEKENLKVALKNTQGEFWLIDAEGNLVDKVIYGKAEEGKSFSKISGNSWSWDTPTKNQENDIFYILEGKIVSGPNEQNKITVTAETHKPATNAQKPLTLKFPANQNTLLLTTILKPQTSAQFLVNKNLEIQDFKIKNPPKPIPIPDIRGTEEWLNYYLIILIGLTIFALQLGKSSHNPRGLFKPNF